ncbi:phage major capsid protein, HK97 family [Nitrosospira sp. Nl5]|uniref:phage major capsid protein n=1 Tax=Nitrosospira sp. Nl5 TaxID=200120 RepID=UPI00088C5BA9|nr:phage major capsid protein [Nitrosospira sp. Nl5]SCY74853.1 phage major capsid protein, HK97 family [Nitrosospira sp. Nl5]
MSNIKQLRESRYALARANRDLIDQNPGKAFDAVQKEFDVNMANIDSLDRQINAAQDKLNDDMEAKLGGGVRAAGTEWRNADSGKKIPVAYASNGSFRDQLKDAFPVPDGFSEHQPKASIGEFMRGVAGMKLTEPVRNSLLVCTDTAGGFTLPHYLQLQMLEAMVPNSSLLQAGAGIARLEQGAKNYRIAAISTIPTAAWRLEAGTVAASDPVFRGVDITPQSLSFYFKISRELLADSSNLDQALFNAIAQSFAKELDRAGLRGTGTDPEIRGMLNTTGIQAVTNGANGASLATTAYANFISATNALLAADAPMPTGAIMSPRSMTVLAGLLDTTNQPRRAPAILDNTKFIATSQIPNNLTVGSSSDCTEIYIGDFSKFIYFMREGVSIQLLKENFAGTGEIGFMCHTRVDAAATYPAALSVVTGVKP